MIAGICPSCFKTCREGLSPQGLCAECEEKNRQHAHDILIAQIRLMPVHTQIELITRSMLLMQDQIAALEKNQPHVHT